MSSVQKRKPNFGEIDCAECGQRVQKNGPMQKYCPPCSEMRDKSRKNAWQKKKYANDPSYRDKAKQVRERNRTREREQRIELGTKLSAQASRSIAWMGEEGPALHSLVRVSFPFSYKYSKNRLWSYAGDRGHVYRRREIKSAHNAMVWEIKHSLGSIRFVNAKVWLDILVQKPNHRGDAVNVVDFVCDAVKDAIGVDDRWFSIRRLDWEIVKENPRLIIGIGQEAITDERACSYCGRTLPLTHFRKGRRECSSCRAPTRAAA